MFIGDRGIGCRCATGCRSMSGSLRAVRSGRSPRSWVGLPRRSAVSSPATRATGGDATSRSGPTERAAGQARRPKLTKLAANPRLHAEVQARLADRCSPQQVTARLRLDFPDDEGMRVSHETIYRAIYVQGRGELRRELHRALRTGRTVRKTARSGGNVGDGCQGW